VRTLAAFATALVATAAAAYVLPSGSILRRMTDGREDVGGGAWHLRGTVSLYNGAAAQAAPVFLQAADVRELQLDAEAWLKVPGRCRLELQGSGAKVASVSSGGKVRSEGTAVEALNVALAHACALLAVRTPGEPEARAWVDRHLAGLGVEWRKNGLARFAGQVTFSLGETTDGKPHLLIYKDTFAPARLRFADAAGQAWDVRFMDYGTAGSGRAFPRVLEVWRGTDLQLRFTALRAEGRAALSDALFQER
jgi:hypothetical protein